jgi:hypothetical protein
MEIISVLVVLFATLVAAFVASYAYGMSQLEDIKTNWVKYRCNPIYMPLAGMVGSDVATNFTNCTLQSVNSYAGFIMDPIYNNFKILTDTIKMILGSMNSMRAAVNGASGGFLQIVQSVIGKLQNTFQTVIQLIGRSRTIMNRMVASFAILMNIVTTGVQTGESVANGPIGKAGQFLQHCFHPDTLIDLLNGVKLRIANVEPGDILANGKVVKSTLEFDGMETPMVSLGGHLGGHLGDVVVSGNHKVLHEGRWIRADTHPDAAESPHCPRIYCLNVEGRELSIGEYTFKDYEETDDPAILEGFFRRVEESHGSLRTPEKTTDMPLKYRFTGVHSATRVMMEDGRLKQAGCVLVGERLMHGGSVIGKAVHDSVERTYYRGCTLALGTWIHDVDGRGIFPAFESPQINLGRDQVVQFLTENARYAIMPYDESENEIIIADIRETTDPAIWEWRSFEVQKQGTL